MALVPYREIIGMINHLAVHTRQEIKYHLSSLSRFVTSPGPRHWLAAKHLLRYLKGTATMGLLFKPFVPGDLVVTGRSDASFASCLDTGRSSVANQLVVLQIYFMIGPARKVIEATITLS